MNISVIQEARPSKVEGVFESESAAKQAVQSLIKEGAFNAQDISLVEPGDESFAQKIEPDDKGIARTLVKSHFILGLGGLIVSLSLAMLLLTVGPAYMRASPLLTFIAFAIIGPLLGFIIAGLLTLRPDHDRLINKAHRATRTERWAVIVHLANGRGKHRAKAVMARSALSLAETF